VSTVSKRSRQDSNLLRHPQDRHSNAEDLNNNIHNSHNSLKANNKSMHKPNMFSFHDEFAPNQEQEFLQDQLREKEKISTKKLPYMKIFNEMYNSCEFDEITPVVE